MGEVSQASQIYATALSTLRRGCALFIPEPNGELSTEYQENGVQIGDVGILRTDGSFDFIFNVCRSASDPINQYGVPDGFIPLQWNGLTRRTDNIFRPGEPVLSRGAERRAVAVEASDSLPRVLRGAGAGFSVKFAKSRGAVIWLPHGATSVDCQSVAKFREYAEKYSISWYRFVNETLGMEVGNGVIYFVTGFDKTDCWENLVIDSTSTERTCELFVATGGLASGEGRFRPFDSACPELFASRCSPADNSKQNQAFFIRGFRITILHRFERLLGRSPMQVADAHLPPRRDALGEGDGTIPFRRGHPTSSSASSSSLHGTSEQTSHSSAAGMQVDTESCALTYHDSHGTDTGREEDHVVPAAQPPQLHHLPAATNMFMLQSEDDVEVAVTHEDDWIPPLNEKDIERHDGFTPISPFEARFEIVIRNGIAFLKPSTNPESQARLEPAAALFSTTSQSSSKSFSSSSDHSNVSNQRQPLGGRFSTSLRDTNSANPSFDIDRQSSSVVAMGQPHFWFETTRPPNLRVAPEGIPGIPLVNSSSPSCENILLPGELADANHTAPQALFTDVSSSQYYVPMPEQPSGFAESLLSSSSNEAYHSSTTASGPFPHIPSFPPYLSDATMSTAATSSFSSSSRGNHNISERSPRSQVLGQSAQVAPRRVGSAAVTANAVNYRRRKATYFCHVAECQSRGFTEKHNYDCMGRCFLRFAYHISNKVTQIICAPI
ncbi:hypothetical protein V5O48_012331 [Marasmius crinis-equi]|uniref:Uncharacterized protein n=1 Tax=Marasmius crinis-equi TaxID=585013 RepID=A0ABR3F318_9AGAR